MPFSWTEQNALNLTEDEQTRRDGAKLATRAKWSVLGANEEALWGLCQGSGKDPYRVCVDKSELAYHCSCPSKKFPCKHTMGLLLLFAKETKLFPLADAPGWVSEWLAARHQRAEKEAEKERAKEQAAQEDGALTSPTETVAQSKRAQARAGKVDDGLKELRLWLSDLVRHGFANPQVKSYAYWDRMAARMVDAQAASIARRLRQIAGIPLQGRPDWAARLFDEVSRLYLLAESYQRIDRLPAALQEDLRTAIGWSYKSDEIIRLPAVRDQWWVVGQVVEGDDSLRTRRVWLIGERSGQAALILDFAAGRASFGRASFGEVYMSGQRYDAELVYYPSAFAQRALVKEIYAISTPDPKHDKLVTYGDFTAMLAAYAAALGCNPWLERIPFVLKHAIIAQRGDGWALFDEASAMLPVNLSGKGEAHLWLALAQSGGHSRVVAGEWDGYEVNLLGVVVPNSRYAAR